MRLDMTTRDGYDIACALRGPDGNVSENTLKWVFTARIRMLAGVKPRSLTGIVRVHAINAPLAENLQRVTGPQHSHFLQHITQAAHALGDDGLAMLAQSVAGGVVRDLTVEEIIEMAGGGTEVKKA